MWSYDSRMRLTYDLQRDVAYLRLRQKPAEVETIHVSDDLNIDIGPGGEVYGIEFLNANEQLTKPDLGKLILENSTTGAVAELDIA